jgi:uncharacterized membrane protein YphA (DoxX/SURF4 family)
MRHVKLLEPIGSVSASRSLRLAARLVLGGVFIYAGVAKIASPREFAIIVTSYRILPEEMAVYAAYVLPWIELMLGTLLVVGLGVRKTALALSFLLFTFAGAVVIRYLQGSGGACGCFSLKASGWESLPLIIGRDVSLLLCGVYLFLCPGRRASPQEKIS